MMVADSVDGWAERMVAGLVEKTASHLVAERVVLTVVLRVGRMGAPTAEKMAEKMVEQMERILAE